MKSLVRLLPQQWKFCLLNVITLEYEGSRQLIQEFVSNYLNFMGALSEYPEHVDREYMQIIASSARHTGQSVRLLSRTLIVWLLQLVSSKVSFWCIDRH